MLVASTDQFSDTEGTTIFVKGFDKYLGEDAIREQLTAAFADCGAVSNVRLPSDRESGELKGIGFIEFATTEAKVCAVSAHKTHASVDKLLTAVHLIKCCVAHSAHGGQRFDARSSVLSSQGIRSADACIGFCNNSPDFGVCFHHSAKLQDSRHECTVRSLCSSK